VTPCYLYSLSALGQVTVWTVNTMSLSEAAVLEMDLGLRQGSCVRLLKVATNIRLGMSVLKPPPAPEDLGKMAEV
jgi:hypothetical protein